MIVNDGSGTLRGVLYSRLCSNCATKRPGVLLLARLRPKRLNTRPHWRVGAGARGTPLRSRPTMRTRNMRTVHVDTRCGSFTLPRARLDRCRATRADGPSGASAAKPPYSYAGAPHSAEAGGPSGGSHP